MKARITSTNQKIIVVKVANGVVHYVPANGISSVFTIPVEEITPVHNKYRFTILGKGEVKPEIRSCTVEAQDLTEAWIKMGIECTPYFGETYLLSEVEECE